MIGSMPVRIAAQCKSMPLANPDLLGMLLFDVLAVLTAWLVGG